MPSWSISTGNGRLTGSKSIRPRAAGTAASIAATRPGPSAIVPGHVEHRRARRPAAARGDEHAGGVLRVLEQRRAAEADGVPPAEDGRDDRLGRAARHPLVAADAVHDHRAQAEARDAVVEPVDAGVALVGELVDAVVVVRMGPGVGGQPARAGIRVVGRVHPDRARVHDRRHPGPASLHRLEHVDRADRR